MTADDRPAASASGPRNLSKSLLWASVHSHPADVPPHLQKITATTALGVTLPRAWLGRPSLLSRYDVWTFPSG